MRPTFCITVGNDEWKSVGDRSPCHEPLSPFDSLNYIRINPDPRLARCVVEIFPPPFPSADCFHRTLVDTLVRAGRGGGGGGGEGFDKCPGGGRRTREGSGNGWKRILARSRTNRYIAYIVLLRMWYHGNYDEFFSKVIRAFRIHPPLPLPRVLLRRTKGVKPVINGTSRNRIGFTSLHLLVSWTNIYIYPETFFNVRQFWPVLFIRTALLTFRVSLSFRHFHVVKINTIIYDLQEGMKCFRIRIEDFRRFRRSFVHSSGMMESRERESVTRDESRWLSRWKFQSNNRYPAIRIGECNSGWSVPFDHVRDRCSLPPLEFKDWNVAIYQLSSLL